MTAGYPEKSLKSRYRQHFSKVWRLCPCATVVLIPLTYSITQGVIWSFLIYTLIKLLLRKGNEVHWMLYVIDGFAVLSLFAPLIES